MKSDLDPWQRLIKRTQERLGETAGGGSYETLIETSEDPGRTFISFPLCFEEERKVREKCDVPAVCLHVEQGAGKTQFRVLIEDRSLSDIFEVAGVNTVDEAERLAHLVVDACVIPLVPKAPSTGGVATELLRAELLRANKGYEYRKVPIPRYDGDEGNLKDIDWLVSTFAHHRNRRVEHMGEQLVRARFGNEDFDFLKSEDLWFVLNNVPTLRVLEKAIDEEIVPRSILDDYVSVEAEREGYKRTQALYQEKGLQVGGQKDYRADNFWRHARPLFAYDPVRGLYYLSIAKEPVMDEFERPYIELLGDVAARRGGIVVEIGFGMGISAGAVQNRLNKVRIARPNEPVAHVIIEYNQEIAALARKWAAWQRVPVVVLEGDWANQIRLIPDGILTGALSDPYPLNPSEKHKDAALSLREIHRCLRPDGVSVHYGDSQYNLFDEEYQLARAAGFSFFGGVTSSFGKHLSTGEYYTKGLRMLVPMLRKDSAYQGKEPERLTLTADEKRDVLKKVFAETSSSWSRRGSLRGISGREVRD
jgi:guanidinoacetate N-methyltransferase